MIHCELKNFNQPGAEKTLEGKSYLEFDYYYYGSQSNTQTVRPYSAFVKSMSKTLFVTFPLYSLTVRDNDSLLSNNDE